MIEAYLDESGIHDGAKVCVIAGYFGGPGQIKKFEIAWRKTLSRFSFPMESFHAKELIKSRGASDMLKALAKTIAEQRKMHPVSYALLVDDFYSFSLEERRFMTGASIDRTSGKLLTSGCPGKPYFLPFQNVIKLVTDAAPDGSEADFNFGIDRPFAEYATALFNQIKENSKKKLPISTWKSRD